MSRGAGYLDRVGIRGYSALLTACAYRGEWGHGNYELLSIIHAIEVRSSLPVYFFDDAVDIRESVPVRKGWQTFPAGHLIDFVLGLLIDSGVEDHEQNEGEQHSFGLWKASDFGKGMHV